MPARKTRGTRKTTGGQSRARKAPADRSRARAGKKRKQGSRTPGSSRAARDAPAPPNEFEQWRASLTPREQRVDEVLQMMQAGEWHAGRSHQALAEKWGVHPGTVEHIAAEANRLLRHAFRSDPEARDEALAECLSTFRTVRLRMLANGSVAALRVACDAAEAFGRYMGIEPPKNVKLQTRDEFDDLELDELRVVAEGGIEALRALRASRREGTN